MRRLAMMLAAALWGGAVAMVPAASAAKPPFRSEAPVARSVALEPVVSPGAQGASQVLSNERTLSRWAHVRRNTTARRGPDLGTRGLKRLRTYTEDDVPEVVLALRQSTAADGMVWVEVRLPMRPNGSTGWVPRQDLGPFNAVTTLLRVDRRALRATLFKGGRRVWSAPVGIGKPRSPTPAGRYYIRERLVPANPNTVYGVFAFGTNGYSPTLTDWPGGGVVGIHGTNQPRILPGRVSNGCVRIENRRIETLRRLMPLGTPIEVV